MSDESLPISPTPVDTSAPRPAPDYPEGADVLVRALAHDEQFWDRHPRVDRYRVAIAPERVDDPEWRVLIWLKPESGSSDEAATPKPAPLPDRPADLDLVFDTAHDAQLLADHPDVVARQADLQVGEHATGAERRLRLWLKRGDA